MFSAYVVVADPPPAPASTVAAPSATSARPISGSMSRAVNCPTDFTCPMFSASSATTAGRKSGSTASENVGAWNSGSPIHAADAIFDVSTSPSASASR